MSSDLTQARKRLDEIDRRFVEVLAERQRIIHEVAALKTNGKSQIRDLQREGEILERLSRLAKEAGLPPFLVSSLYQQILDYSVRFQTDHLTEVQNPDCAAERVVIAYHGTEGSFSHLAAQRHFSARATDMVYHGYTTFRQVVEAVESGDADYAVLPVENTTAGSINESYDLLTQADLSLVGEEVLKVEHCLITLEPVPLRLIRRIASHPQAIAQCSTFLSTLTDCHVESYLDSALAVKKVYEDNDISQAAIASEEAARRYGLHVLKKHISNQKENYTRFVIVAREPVRYDERIPCKTSLIFATPDQKGALMRCLNVFTAHGLNLKKLESRPRWNTPWEYLFYVDFEGNIAQPEVEKALDELSEHTNYLKVLGSYPERTESPLPALRGAQKRDGERRATTGARSATEKKAPVVVVSDRSPYKLASRQHHPEDTEITVGGITIGGRQPVLIAGPCSVESRTQIMQCAEAVHDEGGHILRGGCFKPRTSPYSFQGLGYEGLEYLEEAGRLYGLPIITEVLHPSDVEAVARGADILQIGARNMQNFALLKEVGQVDRPVLLKRGMMASIDEWLAAAEYILAHGNKQVILCERGIRTFETATRNTLDLSAVPVLRERTHLPVIVDPAHACGNWRWIIPLSRAALAAGAHGIMVEIHPEPESALSDGPQSLKFDTFHELAEAFRAFQPASKAPAA